jgi:hypothetical protein
MDHVKHEAGHGQGAALKYRLFQYPDLAELGLLEEWHRHERVAVVSASGVT